MKIISRSLHSQKEIKKCLSFSLFSLLCQWFWPELQFVHVVPESLCRMQFSSETESIHVWLRHAQLSAANCWATRMLTSQPIHQQHQSGPKYEPPFSVSQSPKNFLQKSSKTLAVFLLTEPVHWPPTKLLLTVLSFQSTQALLWFPPTLKSHSSETATKSSSATDF